MHTKKRVRAEKSKNFEGEEGRGERGEKIKSRNTEYTKKGGYFQLKCFPVHHSQPPFPPPPPPPPPPKWTRNPSKKQQEQSKAIKRTVSFRPLHLAL